jgi:hypothetical protein
VSGPVRPAADPAAQLPARTAPTAQPARTAPIDWTALPTGRPRRRPLSRALVPAAVLVFAVVAAVVLAAARTTPIEAPLPSRQVAGIPPLQAVIQDQGSTVALPDGRTLWLFADTAQLNRWPQFFVTSSAGIAAGTDLRLDYLKDAQGRPIEFLPRTAQERADQVQGVHYTAIWPTGATALPDGRILIAYAKYAVRMVPKVAFDFLAGGLFTYSYPGWNGHGLVGANGSDQPANRFADDMWTAQDGPIASPVYSAGYVYFSRCEKFRCYSARSTVPELADRTAYRWWTGSGWSPDVTQRARVTFGSDVPGQNPSIAWSVALKLFVMADTTGGIQSTEGLLWVARQPWGPWSRAAPFALPGCPSGGCYTLNVHPDRSPPGMIRVSFATSGVGPYVRVVDVPVRIEPSDRSAGSRGSKEADVPQIRTHDNASGCALPDLLRCLNP